MKKQSFSLARRLKTAIWVYDIDKSQIAFANEAACRLWKADDEASLKARKMGEGMSSTVATRLKQYQSDFIDSDAQFSELWTLFPDGEPVSVNVIYTGFVMPDGRIAMMCEAQGQSEEKPETLRSTEALLHTDVMITLYALNGGSLYANPAARNALTLSTARFEDIFCSKRDFNAMQAGWRAAGEHRCVAEVKTSNGARWFDLSAKQCLDAATGEPALLVTAVDVTDLKTARDKARYLADRDQLTGCYNRSYFQHHLEAVGESLAASSTGLAGANHALLFLDVDKFKHVNDTFGHEVGDMILQTFATRVQSQIRNTDIVARMGGDEFVVLLQDFQDQNKLLERVEAIRAQILEPMDCGMLQLNVTTSIGVAVWNQENADNWTQILKQADIALYHSKRAGRDRYTVFDASMGAEVLERNWLEAELIKAVEQEAFTLHFQPRVDLTTHKIVSAEALLRWNHPERGNIPPDQFIPICEEMGLIDKVGAFVLRCASERLSAWRKMGFTIDLSVNLSPKQFQDPGLVALFESLASKADYPTCALELEITESSLFGDNSDVARKVSRITDLGFRLALDDFGTGYSNLAHISRFPLRCIKLDKSFIEKLPSSGPLLKLILTLARQIGATTVAEGVESHEQLAWLGEQGCDQVQGFLFSHALPEDQLLALYHDCGEPLQHQQVA